MLLLKLSNANIKFAAEKLTWGSYTVIKALATTRQVKLVDKHNFVQVALDKNYNKLRPLPKSSQSMQTMITYFLPIL